jgi:SAM-dependent methyltransferase
MNYADNFGFQWNRHRRTQIDTDLRRHSADRFWAETGFDPKDLDGALVLDAGCGAGRFAQVAAEAGARVIAVDLSDAVRAARENLQGNPDVRMVQGDLFALPFPPGTFDCVFSLGVIQHTPDPLRAVEKLAEMVRPGGQLGLWWYKRRWYTPLDQKYLLRPLLSRIPKQKLYRLVRWYVPKLLPLSRLIARIPIPGARSISNHLLPVANRDSVSGLTEEEKVEWAILDTFDWYSPQYDLPQTWKSVVEVLKRAGLVVRPTHQGANAFRPARQPN